MATTFGSEVAIAWRQQRSSNGRNYSNETIFFEGDVIYSYGKHFPMAIRKRPENGDDNWYLVNADTYSNTTSNHQSMVREALQYETTMLVPFSALQAAGIDPVETNNGLTLIDAEEERNLPIKRRDPKTGEIYDTTMHLMGACLFSCMGWREVAVMDDEEYYKLSYEEKHEQPDTRFVRDWRMGNYVYIEQKRELGYFLAGLDETGRDPWRSFFLAQLDVTDHVPSTVDEGYKLLQPQQVHEAYDNGDEVLRQGEWFFVEVQESLQKALNTLAKDGKKRIKELGVDRVKLHKELRTYYGKKQLLKNRDEAREQRHLVTECIEFNGDVYAKGTCRHTAGEHKMLKLPQWYKVFENTQIGSWVSAGRID